MEDAENNVNKSEGQIRFKIEKFSEFARATDARRRSDVVFVRGLPWRILAINHESSEQTKNLGYFLQCNVDNPDPGWTCAAKGKLKVLSQKEGEEDYVRPITHVYEPDKNDWGFDKFLTFEDLMTPEYGFYDEQADTILLEAEFTAEAPQGIKNLGRITTFSNAKPNTTITVDKEAVEVNSYLLTLSSTYFERYFFDQRYPAAENIELPEPTTVEDFKRMIATLPPEHRRLDDGCIETVLILADRFFMDDLIELCRNFLLHESRKPKLFIYRIAHKYGWKEIKERILQSMRPDDFTFEKFAENSAELVMLDEDAKAALLARHAELVSGMKK